MNGPLGDLVKQDSRNASWLGNAIGWQGLEDEGKYNTQNPGHAVTKAAETAATWYLGGLLGSSLGAGETAGSAAATAGTDAAESAGTLAVNGAGNAVAPYLASGAMEGGSGLTGAGLSQMMANGGGLDPETLMGQGGMGVAQNGIGPGSMGSQFQGLLNNPSSAFSANGMPANTFNSFAGGSGGGKGMSNLAMQMGAKMMTPQVPQAPMSPPPRGGGDSGSLASPYGNPYGTPAGNSLGSSMPGMPPLGGSGLPMSLTPEQIARLRAAGYRI